MSLRILKAGILDTIQDLGRFSFRHLGINRGGVMDQFAAQTANALTGNDPGEAVIEMHFPAATIHFEKNTLIAITGANFSPSVNGEYISINQPVLVNKNSFLQFNRSETGARAYLSVAGGLNIDPWLNSRSTHLKAGAGGYQGRALQKGDVISCRINADYSKTLQNRDFFILPWKADTEWEKVIGQKILLLPGKEWGKLTESSQDDFLNGIFSVSSFSDRMGYHLDGPVLNTTVHEELLSSAVNFGTIQLLPGGKLILLMADHQVTGGYPRIAHVISAHQPTVAQLKPGDPLQFALTDIQSAENLYIKQQMHLHQLQNACKLKLSSFFNA